MQDKDLIQHNVYVAHDFCIWCWWDLHNFLVWASICSRNPDTSCLAIYTPHMYLTYILFSSHVVLICILHGKCVHAKLGIIWHMELDQFYIYLLVIFQCNIQIALFTRWALYMSDYLNEIGTQTKETVTVHHYVYSLLPTPWILVPSLCSII